MNFAIKAALISVAFLVPTAAFAHSIEPLSRAEVRAELLQLGNAGYNPLSNCTGDCPGSLRRAEAFLERHRADSNAAYGPVFDGTEQSGN
ncbi:DUF4148 domain-containing protein [Caballeronia calidae]|uniref:DUF4148 domain-containing protein n=1 Tax=Caballeronia calidae TaxID=1777139 RepID=UPI0009410F2D|nr:DUF4148 domain-containing protein [Caballeronia calidae]